MEVLHQSLIRGLRWSFSCNVVSKLCNIVILKWLNYKLIMWIKNNGGTSWSNLMRVAKSPFQCAKVRKKSFSAIVGLVPQYCGYTTPNAIMISYSGNCISNFEKSLQVAPSHFSLTLFITMLKTILMIG
jgi:hypothetical protein